MVEEKMVELKIMIPDRWLNFMTECCEVTGWDLEKEMMKMMDAEIGMFVENLGTKDRIHLVEKHHLDDAYKVTQWDRDRADRISLKETPAALQDADMGKIAAILVKKPEYHEAYARHSRLALEEGLAALTPEERAEICTAAPASA
jgi:hypothetical protein